MLIDVSFAILVTTFIAIVIFSHVLLITAIWPNALDEHCEPHVGTIDCDLPLVH